MPDVILVDENDKPLGVMEKMKAHQTGVLHRAFSVFLWDDKGHLLLQKRNESKYHSGGLWTNTCCSHPSPGEPLTKCAGNRLMEEMGIETDLDHAFSFVYRADFHNGLIENEYDHVFIGKFNGKPDPDPAEVSSWRYESLDTIKKEIKNDPEAFTEWFKIALPKLENFLFLKK